MCSSSDNFLNLWFIWMTFFSFMPRIANVHELHEPYYTTFPKSKIRLQL